MKCYKVKLENQSADKHKGQKGELVNQNFGIFVLKFESGKTGSYLENEVIAC